ncbi:MAG: sigma-70 family RNA polymerase sigma factor [Puia sp.]|nr:sigma-70 family RNA polymerase sigma factor [Puia sp.]
MNISSQNIAWFDAFNKGNEASFDLVFKKNSRAMYLFAYSFLANKLDAEEVVMDVFCDLWDERLSIKSPDHLVNWLYLVTERKCLLILRRPKVRHIDIDETHQHIPDAGEEYALIRAEQIRLIEEEILQLPEKMREVFILRYAKGLDPKSTAATLNVDVQTVYTYTKRALEKLRLLLSDRNIESSIFYLIPLIIKALG